MITRRILAIEAGATFAETIPGFQCVGIPPECYWPNPTAANSERFRSYFTPPSGVWEFDDAGTVSEASFTVLNDGSLIVDLSGFRRLEFVTKRVRNPIISRGHRYSGRLLDLGSAYCSKNYYHWLVDAVGRLAVLEGTGMTLGDFDHIRLPFSRSIQIPAIVEALGIPREKIIAPRIGETLMNFDQIIRPTQCGDMGFTHPRLPEFFRKSIPIPDDGPEKVYVRRIGRRMPANQATVEKVLSERGFTVVDPARNSFDCYANASVIVGAHGAGMSGIAFSRPGAKVLELTSHAFQFSHFSTLARAAGHNYWMLVGRGYTSKAMSPTAHFEVPIPQLMDWCDHLGA